jgi:hypothetical protein
MLVTGYHRAWWQAGGRDSSKTYHSQKNQPRKTNGHLALTGVYIFANY